MRPPTVVMIDEHGQRALQMPCVQDQEPIQAVGSSGADKRFCDPIRLGCLNRRPNDSDVFGLEDGIKAARELAIVIADQKRTGSPRSANVQATCRACCVTQSASGWAVHPARWTRR